MPDHNHEFGDLGPILVIIPTYNEKGNIRSIVGRVRAAVPEAHVLIADDNSPDGTGQLGDELADADDHVHVLHRRGKEGLGAAYVAGFSWGIEHGYQVLVEMDADGSHLPEQLPRLLDKLRHADLVLGSRWVDGGMTHNWPKSREVLSRGGNWYIRHALAVPIKDATGGYRAYRSTTLQAIDYQSVGSAGYVFQVDLAYRAVQAGLHVAEVPIDFHEREIGESKMSSSIVREALVRVTGWGFMERRTKSGRQRIRTTKRQQARGW